MKPLLTYLSCSRLALGIKIALILSITLAIYNQDLTITMNEALKSELASHILVIPFLFTYLIYRKRKILRVVIPFETPRRKRNTIQNHEMIGFLLCLQAFLLYWHGSYTFNPFEFHMVSLPIFTAGLILIITNPRALRALAFPIAFLLFLLPPPLELIYTAGTTLSLVSSEAAYTVLKGIGLPVSLTYQYETPVITLMKPGSPAIPFAIDIACSGFYSLTGFTIFAIFTAYIARGAYWKKIVIFLASFPLIYVLNITRITIIVLIGTQYSAEAAMQAFHLFGGWVLIFTGTLILLTTSEKIFHIQFFTAKKGTAPCNYCNQNQEDEQHFCNTCGRTLNPIQINLSKRDLYKIALLTVAVTVIFNLQVPVFALTEGPAEVAIQTLGGEQATAQVLPNIQGYVTRFIYRDRRFEEIAKQDASLAYAYIPYDRLNSTIWITIEVAQTRSSLHRWEVCLLTWPLSKGYQPTVTQLSLRDVQILPNPPTTARYFTFQDKRTNVSQVVLYWYENAVFDTGLSLEQKYVKISLIAFTANPDGLSETEDLLLPFGKAVFKYWQPIKTWSQVALTISQNGAILATATLITLATILIYQTIKEWNERKSNLKVYSKLALEEELILQAVHQASKEDKSTGNAIASHYQRLTGKPIEVKILLEKLNQAEQAGLIKRDVASREDEPILVWKSRIPL